MKFLALLILGLVLATPPMLGAEFGVASWYGRECAGNYMYNGQRFNPNKFTAASRTLPLGTIVKVTNLLNGRAVIVAITDRGPGVLSRDIDLTEAAARRLGYIGLGLVRVKIEVVWWGGKVELSNFWTMVGAWTDTAYFKVPNVQSQAIQGNRRKL
jgi:rare lipoprotein A